MMISEYGHSQPNFEIEAKMIPITKQMLDETEEGLETIIVPSYKRGKGTYKQRQLQGKGVDLIHARRKLVTRTTDVKCFDRDNFTAILIELQKGYIYREGITEADFGKSVDVRNFEIYDRSNGWGVPYCIEPELLPFPLEAPLTSKRQNIILQAYEEAYAFNKGTLQALMEMYPDKFEYYTDKYGNIRKVPWTYSKSTTDEQLKAGKVMVVRNRLLMLNNLEDRMLINLLIKAKYQWLADHWYKIKL